MLALHPRTVDALWSGVERRLPELPLDTHPLGCHRPRRSDRECFEAILHRLVAGCSWDVAGRLGKGSESTLRRRFNEWTDAGGFDGLVEEAIAAYDRIIGLDLSEVAVDGSQHKAPFGGEGTGPNPTDRGKSGWKWSIATDRWGIPIGWEQAGANRNDCVVLEPTLDAVDGRGLLIDIETLHLDRGYDNGVTRALCTELGLNDVVCAKKRPRGSAKKKLPLPLGMRWPVERTNSWLSNFGQLRRNTDRYIHQRLAQFALALLGVLSSASRGSTTAVLDGAAKEEALDSLIADASRSGATTQLATLRRGPVSYEGYEAAISNVVACAKAEGLDIQGPWPDWSGLELEYGVLVDEGDPKGHVDIFDRCYAEYGEFVTQAYYLEIANQRSQRFMELLGCASRSGGASLGEVLTAQGVSVGALLSETPPGVLEECTAR